MSLKASRTIREDDALYQAVQATLLREKMLEFDDGVLIGVSGGRDSVALLVLLAALAGPLNLRLAIAHFHHGLRGRAADEDARWVEALAAAHGLPFHYARDDVRAYGKAFGLSVEEAARNRRYAFLETVARRHGYQRIALGHHADDNAELVLMRLLRGSGPRGLAGMPPVRSLVPGALAIIRPLFDSDRRAIDRFCDRYGLASREDESNHCLEFTRNRIRHALLPRLRADYNPKIAAGLNRLSRLLRDEECWLDRLVTERLGALGARDGAAGIRLDIAALAQDQPALQRRVLRAALQRVRGDLRRVGFEPIEAMRRLVGADGREGRVDLPGDIHARREGRWLHIGPPWAATPPPAFQYQMTAAETVYVRETGVRLVIKQVARVDRNAIRRAGQSVAYFDMDKVVFPIVIRNFRPGDRFVPFGLKGTQKLKKYFIDHKIPRAERRHHPLVISGGEIIWIAGVRRSDRARVGPHTKAVLRGELLVA
jgi:tRNA(Ile)-lysidine synthase